MKNIILSKLSSKRGQVSMEFAILIGAAIAVAAIAGFYYTKHTQSSTKLARDSTSNAQSKIANKNVEYVDSVEALLEK